MHGTAAGIASAALLPGGTVEVLGQERGERPAANSQVRVLNPRGRVPVGLIIDDSTCLVNLNRFAMPQFNEAWGGQRAEYHRNWQDWPAEIPDAFVRRFGEWALDRGVKGKYSIVPYPACVGRMDRFLPGWSRKQLDESLDLVREVMMPNWDIHPEMVTHTRVVDLRTGQPYPDSSPKFMENWEWTTGRSADEIGAYLAYALRILKDAGLSCEGVTTPGGFGSGARPQLAQAALESLRDVFRAEVPHYFRDLYDAGAESVAPRVELAAGLRGEDARCVVSVVGCTGDWTGGWDCVEPEGVDRFITADLQHGRLPDVIRREEPAVMVCHWTGIYWNGEERGFRILQEVERRVRAGFGDRVVWMKLCEIARYWAARELTVMELAERGLTLQAPFACPAFTVKWRPAAQGRPALVTGETKHWLREVDRPQDLDSGTYRWEGQDCVACISMPKGRSRVLLESNNG